MTFLNPDQLDELMDGGYLVVPDVPGLPNAINRVADEYEVVLHELLRYLRMRGELSTDIPRELGFAARMTAAVRETGTDYSHHFNIALAPDDVTETSPYRASPAIFHLLREPRLLDVVESVIGPEILATPILYVRLKPPQRLLSRNFAPRPSTESTAPHQDNSGLLPEADSTDMLTVWIPMADVTEANGCLHVWPGSHRRGVLPHRVEPGRTVITRDALAELGPPVTAPVRRGSVLLMHRRLVHASLPNCSDTTRWSFDLRYQPADQPPVRAFLPGFVARSRAHPASELRDPEEWDRLWSQARRRLARAGTPRFHRWVSTESSPTEREHSSPAADSDDSMKPPLPDPPQGRERVDD
ncbi:MAG: phytanoyl-CoA dioxygenase family protein [Pseudonocardiaceae bacterium]